MVLSIELLLRIASSCSDRPVALLQAAYSVFCLMPFLDFLHVVDSALGVSITLVCLAFHTLPWVGVLSSFHYDDVSFDLSFYAILSEFAITVPVDNGFPC